MEPERGASAGGALDSYARTLAKLPARATTAASHHAPRSGGTGPPQRCRDRRTWSRGKTPVLQPEKLGPLLEMSSVGGRRDRVFGTMLYNFARVSPIVSINVHDYYQQRRRCWPELREKGGTRCCGRCGRGTGSLALPGTEVSSANVDTLSPARDTKPWGSGR